ncbi:MAG: rhodanese-like domain-containing protein [Acidobacteria bacterium]|nr:rhodanese-like domain-containing protein [Acidobacteriota bacterium]
MGKPCAFALIVMALVAIWSECGATQEQKAKQPERIAINDLKKKLDSGEKFLLVDVREDWEIKQDGAIPGAIHIPVADLDARMKDIPKDVEVVFY